LTTRPRVISVFVATTVLVGTALFLSAPAVAQKGRDTQHRRDRGAPYQPGTAPAGVQGAENPFYPSQEDFGPLREGEEQELLEFAQEKMPRAYQLLSRLRDRDPQRYQAHLERFAARVRHLRRIFEQDAELGQIIIRHSRNLFELQRARRAWQRGRGDPGRQGRLLRGMRERLAENVELEAQALERWVAIRDRMRDQDIQRKLMRLARADPVELAREPSEIREALATWQDAPDDEQRAQAQAELESLLAEHIDAELARLREQAAGLLTDAPVLVDRRMRELLERTDGPPGRPERHGQRKYGGKRGSKRGPPSRER
jgi:hypothetical protein